MTRTERLFALAEHLRGRRSGITAGELAERFNVTVRTIHRDLTSLRMADMPISSERGRGGGFSLDAHYTLPPINIAAREAAVLLMLTSYAKEMRLLPFNETLESAANKVRAALSASGQRELARKLSELAFVGVPSKPIANGVARAVERAWFEQSVLAIVYPVGEYGRARMNIKIRSFVLDRNETRLNVTNEKGHDRQLRLDRILLA
jgi:predicted DNA-binding transcriptional regulator YafY